MGWQLKMEKDNDALKNVKQPEQAPGEGIRKLRTSNVFRTLNFELYVKPNKYMMWFGAITFTSCVSYIFYMKYQHKNERVYTAMDDNDQLVLRKKRSGWD